MKTLTPEQLEKNFSDLCMIISKELTGDKGDALLELHIGLKNRMYEAPASGTDYFHSAYKGGYIVHVLNVVNCVRELYGVWKKLGAEFDYSFEELMLVAICHDLGKIGDLNGSYYLINTSEWHVKNQGKNFVINDAIQHMQVQDRSLFLLQYFGIQLTQNEWLGIKIHDGLYDEANKSYLQSFSKGNILKTNLPIIIHHADILAYRLEYEQWLKEKQE